MDSLFIQATKSLGTVALEFAICCWYILAPFLLLHAFIFRSMIVRLSNGRGHREGQRCATR